MEKAELKKWWKTGTCFFLQSLSLGGKRTKQDYNFYFSIPGSSRKDAFKHCPEDRWGNVISEALW